MTAQISLIIERRKIINGIMKYANIFLKMRSNEFYRYNDLYKLNYCLCNIYGGRQAIVS